MAALSVFIHWLLCLNFWKWAEIVKIGGALGAFAIGLWQYNRGQVWKRLEFVSGEMKIFFDDPAVKSAMSMLDWRKKRIALYKFKGENDLALVDIDYETVAKSLGVDPDMKYDKVESAIRDTFERFLEYLARFEGFLAAGAVKSKDLNPYIDYWMKLISGNDPHAPEVTKMVLPSLWRFVDFFGYRDVRRLVGRYHTVAFPELKH